MNTKNLDTENDALTLQLMIMEGERSDSEARISYLESRELGANQQVEELKARVEELVRQKESLEEQLELADKIKQDITMFCD